MKKLQMMTMAVVLAGSLTGVAFGQMDEGDNENHGGRVVSPAGGRYGRGMEASFEQTLETVMTVLRAKGVYLPGM